MIGWNDEYDGMSNKDILECLKMDEILKAKSKLIEALEQFEINKEADDFWLYLSDVDDLLYVYKFVEARAQKLLGCVNELKSSFKDADELEIFDELEDMIKEQARELFNMLDDYSKLLIDNE